MIPAVVIVGGTLALLLLATIGKSQMEAAAESSTTPDTGGNSVPNAMATAMPDDVSKTDDNISSTSLPAWRNGGISTDPDTWPSGDAIWDICRAIAMAEGYNTNGAAFKLNNPGDISDGKSVYGSEHHDGSEITHFPDAATGWNWLYNKIKNHISGKSSVYPVSLTITQFSQKYAAKWQPWKIKVGSMLQVNPDSTSFADYVGV